VRRDCEDQSSIKRGLQVPDAVGLADVTRVDEVRVLETELGAAEVRGVIIADDDRVLETTEDEELPPVLPPQPS